MKVVEYAALMVLQYIKIIMQLLTIEALDMMWYRPENTNIDRGGFSKRKKSNNINKILAMDRVYTVC